MNKPARNQLANNIRWGLRFGLTLAVLFSVYVGLLVVLEIKRPFENNHIRPLALIAAYFVGGTLGGLIVGLARPLITSGWRAAFTGVLTVIPFFMTFLFLR